MKKADRMEDFIRALGSESAQAAQTSEAAWPAPYAGYFMCFNRGEFYEAHDVLEHLWLRTTSAEAGYYKGLIQVAGGFVHLRQHYLRPLHHKYGKRLRPAARLFRLALGQFEPYPDFFYGLDLAELRSLCEAQIATIEQSQGTQNPWRPETSPQLSLEPPAPGSAGH